MTNQPVSHNTASADDGHAVRWASDYEGQAVRWAARDVRGEPDWTRWHWVDEGEVTVCGRRLTTVSGRMAFSGRAERVDCKRCRKWLEGRNGGKVDTTP